MPIYLQLVERIREKIISGKFAPGERLPSVRDWSISEKVNPNTLQKALGKLEEDGLILTERTNGKFVTSDLPLIHRYRKEEAEKIAREYLGKMKGIGFDEKDALLYLKQSNQED